MERIKPHLETRRDIASAKSPVGCDEIICDGGAGIHDQQILVRMERHGSYSRRYAVSPESARSAVVYLDRQTATARQAAYMPGYVPYAFEHGFAVVRHGAIYGGVDGSAPIGETFDGLYAQMLLVDYVNEPGVIPQCHFGYRIALIDGKIQ